MAPNPLRREPQPRQWTAWSLTEDDVSFVEAFEGRRSFFRSQGLTYMLRYHLHTTSALLYLHLALGLQEARPHVGWMTRLNRPLMQFAA